MASTLPPNDAAILEHVEKFWQQRLPHSPIYQFLLSDIKLTHASKGIVRARLLLTKNTSTSTAAFTDPSRPH
jgi:acyl-coenzyme A thioesterase 13